VEALYSEKFQSKYRKIKLFNGVKKANDFSNNNQFLDYLLKLQFDDWLQDNLLLRQDKNTMAHSLELRVPFLDHNLVELAFQMPAHLKVRGLVDKYIERDLARKVLPRRNVKRRKIPFYIPLEYFHHNPEIRELIRLTLNRRQVEKRGYFNYSMVKTLVEKIESGEFMYLKQVMSLVILELWHLIFIDKQKLW
jgi:asparagine synthase (glutamine-hydrolysing)